MNQRHPFLLPYATGKTAQKALPRSASTPSRSRPDRTPLPNHGATANKVHVEWKSDGKNSDEFLAVLLRPSLGLKLLPYATGGE